VALEGPAIAIRDLAKSYGRVHAVRGITFDVQHGEIFGFLGLNGAGKTTTIRILLDLLRPTRGQAQLFGLDCQRQSRLARARVGYMPGELGFYADMTGLEVLDLMARLSGGVRDTGRRLQMADRLELAQADLRRPLRAYSTGMKRKLGLIQALQADPPLLVLDEPTEGLDPLVQRALHQLLLELRARGRTIFMSSHVLSEVERLCDRIGVIREGEIVLLSTVEEARRRSGRTVRIQFAQPVEAMPLPDGMSLIDSTPERWSVKVEHEIGPLLPILTHLPVRDLEILEPALEDVLRSFYRSEAP
jgi:ABC-2 type transport system ATP-binding protein